MPKPSDPIFARRADLDWLRLGAFALLALYHAGFPWSGWNSPLASSESIGWLREGMRFLERWRMPLIFVVSGAAIVLALGTRSVGVFAIDRVRRLLVPLAFGMVVLGPPQDYLEPLYGNEFHGSFLDFIWQAFTGMYPGGKMHWHHLWFLAYALALTFALLPCFLWLRSAPGRAFHIRAGSIVARTGLQWLLALFMAAALLWVAPTSDGTNDYGRDGLGYWAVLLLYGAFLFGSSELLVALNRQRFLSLSIGIAAYAAFYIFFINGSVRAVISKDALPIYTLLSAVNTTAWLFAIIGFGHRYLTWRPVFLAELTEAVYPFYLLHQTVLVVATYWLLRFNVPPLAGFIVAVLATFLGTSAIYFCLVRPMGLLRPFFGLKLGRITTPRQLDRRLERGPTKRSPAAACE
jgi:glucan biosynthesis protein C